MGPINVYYEINNFYINHKDFVTSLNYEQLRGHDITNDTMKKDCKGAQFIWEIFDNKSEKYVTHTNQSLNWDFIANPCGLMAKNFFTGNLNSLF